MVKHVLPHRKAGVCIAIVGFLPLFAGIMMIAVTRTASVNDNTDPAMKAMGPICLTAGFLLIFGGFIFQFVRHKMWKRKMEKQNKDGDKYNLEADNASVNAESVASTSTAGATGSSRGCDDSVNFDDINVISKNYYGHDDDDDDDFDEDNYKEFQRENSYNDHNRVRHINDGHYHQDGSLKNKSTRTSVIQNFEASSNNNNSVVSIRKNGKKSDSNLSGVKSSQRNSMAGRNAGDKKRAVRTIEDEIKEMRTPDQLSIRGQASPITDAEITDLESSAGSTALPGSMYNLHDSD